jgi:hypothetical protein
VDHVLYIVRGKPDVSGAFFGHDGIVLENYLIYLTHISLLPLDTILIIGERRFFLTHYGFRRLFNEFKIFFRTM